jgi:hypothetical protein
MQDPVERRRKAQKRKYPKNWARISQRIRFDRAGGKCEQCGMAHGESVRVGAEGCWAGEEGRWRDCKGKRLPGPLPWPKDYWWRYVIQHGGETPQIREAVVVLQTAHLDHNPENCADENLAALCQFCHARYDAQQRLFSAGISWDLRKGQRVLWK